MDSDLDISNTGRSSPRQNRLFLHELFEEVVFEFEPILYRNYWSLPELYHSSTYAELKKNTVGFQSPWPYAFIASGGGGAVRGATL
jgi:hypothetical protein